MLATSILEFIEYHLSSNSKSLLQLPDLALLPPKLAVGLTIELHRDLIAQCRLFRSLPSRIVLQLLEMLRPVVRLPGDLLISEGRPNSTLYFISRGTVRVWKNFRTPCARDHLATLSCNDFFGEGAIIGGDGGKGDNAGGGIASATCECATYCDLLILTKEVLLPPAIEQLAHPLLTAPHPVAVPSGLQQGDGRVQGDEQRRVVHGRAQGNRRQSQQGFHAQLGRWD